MTSHSGPLSNHLNVASRTMVSTISRRLVCGRNPILLRALLQDQLRPPDVGDGRFKGPFDDQPHPHCRAWMKDHIRAGNRIIDSMREVARRLGDLQIALMDLAIESSIK